MAKLKKKILEDEVYLNMKPDFNRPKPSYFPDEVLVTVENEMIEESG